ncbi:MAG: hypothetical protein IK105_07135 [Thermoguttaceae bacterium]|nr:hypothetical protein [Thermoguttaceae bacterium]
MNPFLFVVPALPQKRNTENPDELQKFVVSSNWRTPAAKLPHMLIHNQGEQLEEIAAGFIREVNGQSNDDQVVTIAGEMSNLPGISRPLRVVHQIQPGHIVATDVLLLREGNDLYVRFALQTRTLLAWLRRIWLGLIFFAVVSVLLTGYLKVTGARKSWAKDYAEKHAKLEYPDEEKTAFLTRRVLEGYYITEWPAFREEYVKNTKLYEEAADFFPYRRLPCPGSDRNPMEEPRLGALKNGGRYERFPEYLMWFYTDNIQGDLYVRFFCRDTEHIAPGSYFYDGWIRQPHSTHWVKEAALKETLVAYYTNDRYPDMAKEIANVFDHHTTWYPPMTMMQLFRADPRNAMFNFSLPISIIAALVGFWIWRSPLSWLRFPCRLLGWVFPDDYNDAAIARMAGVKRIFDETLKNYGITRDQADELGGDK